MDTQSLIAELEAERDRLDKAIAALQGSRRAGTSRLGGNGRKGGRRLSPEVRRRISEGMRKRWAARKKAAA